MAERSEGGRGLVEAEAAQRGGDLRGAMEILEGLVERSPRDVEARRRLGLVMSAIGDPGAAVEHIRAALEARPEDARLHYDLGQVLERAGDLEGAREAYERAEGLAPGEAEYPARIALLCARLRDIAGVRIAGERALALDPDKDFALLALAEASRREGRLDEAEVHARRVVEVTSDDRRRGAAWHEIGRVMEKRARWDEAFEAHMAGNAAKLRTPAARDAIRLNMGSQFLPYLGHGDGAGRYRRWGEARYSDGIAAPVSVTGFPRSGTTMMEQILGAHPGIATCEERPLCQRVRLELHGMLGEEAGLRAFLESLDGLTEAQVLRLRRVYREGLEAGVGAEERGRVLVDKHPLRTMDLGLMNRLFPEARVVVLIRDPRDVCLSALFQDFVVNPAMVRFFSLGLCAEWYEKVMGFWLRLREMLSIEVLEVRYEELVSDFEGWAPRLLEFVGVEWDDRVRDFHERASGRVVLSSSYEAVTERLNTRSIGRWKRYAGKLEPILGRLEPFVEAFGYEPSEGSA